MKRKKGDDYRKMAPVELERTINDLNKELAILKLKKNTEANKDTNVISKGRKRLAILLTVKREKEIVSVVR